VKSETIERVPSIVDDPRAREPALVQLAAVSAGSPRIATILCREIISRWPARDAGVGDLRRIMNAPCTIVADVHPATKREYDRPPISLLRRPSRFARASERTDGAIARINASCVISRVLHAGLTS